MRTPIASETRPELPRPDVHAPRDRRHALARVAAGAAPVEIAA